MRILPETTESIAEALNVLRGGGSVVHATETCYGIACDLSNNDAVSKMFGVKQRPIEQPVSALFFSVDHAKEYVMWNDRAEELAREFLPGPLTLILPLKKNAHSVLFPTPQGGETIGIRISSHPFAQKIVEEFGSPISTTSANIHRHENSYCLAELQYEFGRQMLKPDLIIDSGELPKREPSRIIDLTNNEKIVRE